MKYGCEMLGRVFFFGGVGGGPAALVFQLSVWFLWDEFLGVY